MDGCTWIGFFGYIFGFLLFLLGTVFGVVDMLKHIFFGFKQGFFFAYEKNKMNNPITNILFFGFMAVVSIYVISFDLPPKIIKYWQCLMG